MSEKFKKHTFKNGLRLITVPMKNTKTITVLVLVGAGSKYETKEINGISHFLEHMFFKGTKKRPNTLTIAETLDRVGGNYNAFTGPEYTGYWAKVDNKNLELALDWVSDIFLNSKIQEREINREKGVILEEINVYLDTPMYYIDDLWSDLLYGDQPAGWRVIGKENIIKKLARKDFTNYLGNHYSSFNTIVVVAGDIKKSKDFELKIENYFKNINIKKPKQKNKTVEKQNKPKALIYYKKTDQTHIYLGVRAYDVFHKDKYALIVLKTVLGGNMSSRIWIDVREKHGLSYYVRTDIDFHTDVGSLYTCAGINNKRIDRAIQIILKNYKRLKKERISKKELQKAKDYIRGNSILNMEVSNELANFYGKQELLENNILTLEQKLAKIDSVTIKDIQRVAKDIFVPEKLNLALIGPFKNKSKFEKLLKI